MPPPCPRIWMVFLFFATTCLPGSLYAQEPKDDETDAVDQQAAKRHFDRGAELFRAEQYEEAIDAFDRALEADPNAMIHYNLSLAYLKDDQLPEALRHARKAAEFGDMPRTAAVRNRARMDALETILRARDTGTAYADAGADSRAPATNPLYDPAPDSESSEPTDSAESGEARRGAFSPTGWVGLGLAVGGIGSLGGAAAIDAGLRSDVANYRRAAERGDAETYHRLRDSIGNRQTAGRVFLYSGAVLTAVGGGLLIYDLVGSSDSGGDTSASPVTLAPTGPGVRLDIAF